MSRPSSMAIMEVRYSNLVHASRWPWSLGSTSRKGSRSSPFSQ